MVEVSERKAPDSGRLVTNLWFDVANGIEKLKNSDTLIYTTRNLNDLRMFLTEARIL